MQDVPAGRPPVEWKVKAAAVGSYLGSVGVLAVLQAVNSDLSLLDWLPDWAETIVIPLIPTAITAAAAWGARHTPRPDLPMAQR